MKKSIVKLMLVAMMAMVLGGCGSEAECDFCGEEKRCETRTVMGEEINCCNDCLDELKDMFY